MYIFALSQLQGVEWGWPGRREPDDEHSPASSSFILYFYLCWYPCIVYFVRDSASEFGAMGSTSFLGFSYPNLPLVFLNLLFLGSCLIFFSQVLGLSLGLFYFYRYFSVPYFGLACDHGNSFLCLEEVRTDFNVKTTTTRTTIISIGESV